MPTEPDPDPGTGYDREPSPLALSHHQPEHYDRCLRVGRFHVCRRCTILYPLAFVVMGLSLAGIGWSGDLDGLLLVLLPMPAVVEFWLEQLGRVSYRPWRQIAVTVPLALALGRGFARYVENPADPLFWGMVVVYGGACMGVLLWRILDERAL